MNNAILLRHIYVSIVNETENSIISFTQNLYENVAMSKTLLERRARPTGPAGAQG